MDTRERYIQLSVFDRLTTDDDLGMSGGRTNDIAVVRRAVLRDIENLLNTRRSMRAPATGFRYLNVSLYAYGLADFISQNPKSPIVRRALKTGIEETIARFEPRLVNVSVAFNPRDDITHSLCFSVRATLYADPVQEPICFDTWLSVDRGECRIDNVK